MYLLKRKQDNRYWDRNAWFWRDDPALCVPFRTRGGVRNCAGASLQNPYPREPIGTPAYREWNRWFTDPRKRRERNEVFGLLYEIVRVRVVLVNDGDGA